MPEASNGMDTQWKFHHSVEPACSCSRVCAFTSTVAVPRDVAERHDNEVAARLRWCIASGKTPAHDFVHLAPGDDSQFAYGVPPWNPDGTPNPCGVFTAPESDEERSVRTTQKNISSGWVCKREGCNTWIDAIPREYTRGSEPLNWWWCLQCKGKFKVSKRDEKRLREAAQCKKINDFV